MTASGLSMRDFTASLLARAGALVADTGPGLEVVVADGLASQLGLGDFERLVFAPNDMESHARLVDYDSPVFDQMGALVESLGRIAVVAPPPVSLPAIDAGAELLRALTFANGVVRDARVTTGEATYARFVFEYDVLADERAGGLIDIWINATTRSRPRMASWSEPDDLDSTPAGPDGDVELPWREAEAGASAEIHPILAGFLDSLTRRRERDLRRLREYFLEIDQGLRRKLARAAAGSDTWRRERERLEATARAYHARLADVADRYRVRVRVNPVGVLVSRLPVLEVTARLMRRTRAVGGAFSWNPLDRRIESPCCRGCARPVSNVWLCDDQVHMLCEPCLSPCARCGRTYCRACHRQCPRRHDR